MAAFRDLSRYLYEGAYKIQSNVLDIGIVPRFIIKCKPGGSRQDCVLAADETNNQCFIETQ
jgi:hypothetical protein